jgi:transposase-like protein
LWQKKPVQLSGEIEADEVYIVAGHKGLPAEVRKAGRNGRRRRLKGKRGRGTLAGDKPPVLGLLQRDGEVVIRMLPNVQQRTIQPVITNSVAPDSQFYTDEYDIYDRLSEWGYQHKKVNHSAGEYAWMKMETVFMKSMPIPWKVFGLCYVPGCGRIVASPRKNYPAIWASLNSFATFADGARLCSIPYSHFS